MSSDLVIVYHRQPFEEVEVNGRTVRQDNKSPNGIVPTLKSFFGGVGKGAWVAWKLAEDPNDPGFERRVEVEDSFGTYTVSRLPLTAQEVSSFYHITSKEAFWPILHGFKDRYNYDPVDWSTFREVNWAFAQAAANEADQGAMVWVHDYNLWLVPGYLRQLRPDLRISFFHHTPFPSSDLFNVLPWRVEIIESLLACDIIGFHIPRYAVNFVSVVRSLFDVDIVEREKVSDDFSPEGMALSERTVPTSFQYQGRRILVSAFPVGVDADYIAGLSTELDTATKIRQIRDDLGDVRLIVAVSRTDYTKGNIELLEAFDRLLERRPELINKIQLMHVSVSANSNMTAYNEIQNEIEQLAGHINGRYGSLEWQPVALISTAIPFNSLVAYYGAADIAWVTPLADGLNLVAKEFVASRSDGDGVLVLSEFAGVAVEMPEAVLTNPWSTRSMDAAIDQALDMSEKERRNRMSELRKKVQRFDIRAWAGEQQRLFEEVSNRNDDAGEDEQDAQDGSAAA